VLAGVAGAVAFALRGGRPARSEDPEDVRAKRTPSEAERKWLAAAEKGDAASQYMLGRAYYHGYDGLKADPDEAVKWLRRGDAQDNPDATTLLGLCHAQGAGVPRDVAEAMRLFKKAHRNGGVWAAREIGLLYAQGAAGKIDHEEAVRWYRLSAERGDAFADYCLGNAYADGQGVKKDMDKAREHLEKAAANGSEEAKTALPDLAKRQWLPDAQRGVASAQAALGCAIAFGQPGVRPDPVEGAKWLKKAADQGDDHAQANLGNLYWTGEGVPEDKKEAVRLWKLAVVKNHPVALNNLAGVYEKGVVVEPNLAEAVRLYREAVKRNWPSAQFNLSRLYRTGVGVDKDVAEADRLLKLAADGGLEDAKAEWARLNKQSSKAVPPKADVRGTVTKLTLADSGDALAGVLVVEGGKEEDTRYARGSVSMTIGATKVYRWANGKKESAKLEAIKEGAKVQCVLIDPAAQGDTAVGTASEVIILEDPKKK
jgi:TPR repeat protein